jgi:predicted amidohydrolase YtcJ
MHPDDETATSERFAALAKSIGSERASRAWPAASLVSAHAPLALAVGSPQGMSPLAAVQIAVTRSSPDGLPDGASSAAERVSIKRAINGFTSVPAYASFDEQRKGSLEKGMLADLVVLSEDIFDGSEADLGRATVAATIFDGKIVYQSRAKSTN